MCLLILNRGNGTPFDASSLLEEEIIEICIQLGHTYPEGVLWYSTIELVILFHTVDELLIVVHGVVKVMMLHDESIRVRTSPPSVTHLWAYMAVVGGEPSSAQPLPSDGEKEPHLSPSVPHPSGRIQQHLQAYLRGLMDNELQQLMEEFCSEIAL